MRTDSQNKKRKVAGVLTGASLLMTGCAAAVPAPCADVAKSNVTDAEPAKETPAWLGEMAAKEEKNVIKVANISGQFAFNQDILTPDDEVFNLYGTVMTGLCATPAFAVEDREDYGYYINVGGKIEKAFTVNVAELAEENSESRIMKCSCSMSAQGLANARVMGIPLSAVLEMAQMEETVNCITVYGADGYGVPMPLTYAMEKEAMLVYQINGQKIGAENGGSVQLWMPEAVARYFTRNVTHIELSAEAREPEVLKAEDAYRAKINILNYADDVEFAAGETITLEGYADDFDVAIEAVEFSLDGGETWTTCETKDATTDRWVYWEFSFILNEPGDYEMTVRARTADGKESPLASTLAFHINGEAKSY